MDVIYKTLLSSYRPLKVPRNTSHDSPVHTHIHTHKVAEASIQDATCSSGAIIVQMHTHTDG